MAHCAPSRNCHYSSDEESPIYHLLRPNMICSTKIKAVAVALALACVSSTYGAAVSGEIALKETDSSAKESFMKVFGDTLKVTTNWRVGDFFGKQTVFAGV